MTMTIEQMKAAIAKAQNEARAEADKLKAKRDKARAEADKAHEAYITFCKDNDIPVSRGRPKGSKNKANEETKEES